MIGYHTTYIHRTACALIWTLVFCSRCVYDIPTTTERKRVVIQTECQLPIHELAELKLSQMHMKHTAKKHENNKNKNRNRHNNIQHRVKPKENALAYTVKVMKKIMSLLNVMRWEKKEKNISTIARQNHVNYTTSNQILHPHTFVYFWLLYLFGQLPVVGGVVA